MTGDKDQELEKLLFEVLDEQSSVHVPYTFSSSVTQVIRKRRNRVNDIKLYILISVMCLFGLGIAGMCLLMVDKRSTAVLLEVIVAYKWVWLIALATIFGVQYIDQRLVTKGSL